MAGLKSVVKTVLSLKMLFPLNFLRLSIDFSEITLENRFSPNLYFYIFGLELLRRWKNEAFASDSFYVLKLAFFTV